MIVSFLPSGAEGGEICRGVRLNLLTGRLIGVSGASALGPTPAPVLGPLPSGGLRRGKAPGRVSRPRRGDRGPAPTGQKEALVDRDPPAALQLLVPEGVWRNAVFSEAV